MEGKDAGRHEVTGWTYTRVDCPDCGWLTYAEGDARGQEVKCDNPDCGTILFVAEVM